MTRAQATGSSQADVVYLGRVAPHVTVAVPVKDRRERMLRCLEALLSQDYAAYDVLVLDNGSSDGTVEACRARALETDVPVRVETVDGSLGRVRNAGARMATGEVLACTDSDCIPAPGWLSAGVRTLSDQRVGVVTGSTVPEHPPPYAPWLLTREIRDQTWHFDACNVFFRRAPLLQTEGFGDDLNWGEDTIAGWAMLRAGWEASFAPDALVYHDVTYPGRAWHLRRVREYGNVAAVISQYPEARERLLWSRYFMRPRNATFAAALAGLALTALDRRALLLALPYLRERGPRRIHPRALYDSVERLAIDASVFTGAVRGSVRWRRLVL